MRRARLFDRVSDGVPQFDPTRPRLDDERERARIGGFLDGGALVRRTTGRDVDRLEPGRGRVVPMSTHTDGVWIWNAALKYYVEVHGILPEEDFLQHMADHGYEAPRPTPDQVQEALQQLRSAQS